MLEITIKVDTNDDDCLTSTNPISEVDLTKIKPLIQAIKYFAPYTTANNDVHAAGWNHHHNYPYGMCYRPDLGEKSPGELYPHISQEAFRLFEGLLPRDNFGCHTIKSIYVCPLIIRERLL